MAQQRTADTSTAVQAAERRVPVVIQVTPDLHGGNAARGAIDLARAVKAAGGKSIVISGGGNLHTELARAAVEHIPLSIDAGSSYVRKRAGKRLGELLEEKAAHIAHVRSLPALEAALLMREKLALRIVASVFEFEESLGFFGRKRLRALGEADAVIAVSRYVAGALKSSLRLEDRLVSVVPPGVDMSRYSATAVSHERIIQMAHAWRVPEDRRIILVPARYKPTAGLEYVVEAVKRLDRADIFCILLGDEAEFGGRRGEIEAVIKRFDAGGLVQMADYSNDMPAAYMLADTVVVADTAAKGSSRVVLEAQAMGRPIIATDVGGVAEGLLPGVTGWDVPPRNAGSLANALATTLALGATERAKLALTSVQHIADHYSLDAMSEATLAIYDRLLEELSHAVRT